MRYLSFLILFISLNLQADEGVLEFIKKNYEYNIDLIEQTYAENGIHLDLDDKDRTINLKNLKGIQHKHPLAELGLKLNLMKKKFSKQLTSLEKKLLELFPQESYYIGFQSYFALTKTTEIYQKDFIGEIIDVSDPKVDSFKHTYWSHLISHKVNPEFAKLWFTARELRKQTSGLVDLRDNVNGYMDMLNNVIGMKIPEDTFKERLLGASVPSLISRKQKYGKLFFNDHGVIRTTDQID